MHGNCSLFVKKPSRSEWRKLREVARKTDRNIRDRAMVVIMSASGIPVPEIMVRLARCREYVIYWLKRFNGYGFEGLETRARSGRPRTFTDKLVARIKSIATIPAISTHQQQGEEARKMADIPPNLIRLCVGAENPNDIIKDLKQALNKIE